ncbi:MAG: lysine transporter LysE [Firmicutes bacterium HGW-Firmicutes-1]|jgi:threonine/homoserine/homoserine lactone efflux protein|nr:MAG: lysine transporter LysE [Firmicutes bacterium HGW-Firmicutes-1]
MMIVSTMWNVRRMKMMIFKGLKFGMLLQIAIGPISIYVFNISSNHGFIQGEIAATAVTLADSLFILLALLGLTTFLEHQKVKKYVTLFGAIVIAIFGINIILEVFGHGLLPNIQLFHIQSNNNVFLYAFFLTCANPLTILFWAGVFSSKLSKENYNKKDMYLFGIGSATSTLIALTSVSIIGTITKSFLSENIVGILNGIVGVVLVIYAIKMIFIKREKSQITTIN